MNSIDMQVAVEMRERYMYPKNKKEFLEYCRKLDNDKKAIERIFKSSFNIYFSIYQYYKNNSKNIKEIINIII